MSINKKIVFIGGGNMAEALLKGLLSANLIAAQNIIVTDIKNERLDYLSKEYSIKTSTKNIVPGSDADIIVLAVKPQNIEEVLSELKAVVTQNKLVVSIAAGVTVKQLQKEATWKVVRVMPNTPALIGEGISALCCSQAVTEEEKQMVSTIFNAVGSTVWVEEKDINSVTALSGSGPAFVYCLVESFLNAGKEIGLSEAVSKKLVFQTFIGATRMCEKTGESSAVLVKRVASPGGTTEYGLKVLENSDVQKKLIETIKAAKIRADELSKGV